MTGHCGAICLYLSWVRTSWASRPESIRTAFRNLQAKYGLPLGQANGRIGWGLGNGTFNEWHIKMGLSVAKFYADDWSIAQRIESLSSISRSLGSILQSPLNLRWWYMSLSGVGVLEDQESRPSQPQLTPPTRASVCILHSRKIRLKVGQD